MSILKQVEEKLKEEQWTRASIENFNIQPLEQLLKSVLSSSEKETIFDQTLEFLQNSPKSITALYLTGFLAYELGYKGYDSHLSVLMEIFKEHKKVSVVEIIADKVLVSDPNNKYALESLLNIYASQKKDKEHFEILSQLMKIDAKNGSIPEKIAEYYENNPKENVLDARGNSQSTLCYQLALRRYTKLQNFSKIEQIWKKLLPTSYNQVNFFISIAFNLADFNLDQSLSLLFSLIETLKEHKMFDEALFILKKIFVIDPSNSKLREQMISIYTLKYADHPQLTLCLESTGLNDPSKSLTSSVKKFEKEILFKEKGYVCHKTWGIGLLKKFQDGDFILDFDAKKNHKMSYNMALFSLIPLTENHIWVLKKLDKIKAVQSEKDITEVLLIILNSFPNKPLSTEDFKMELCPQYIAPESWSNWWNKAKKILQNLPSVGSLKEGRPKYFIRSISITFEEELIEQFNESKKFEEKLLIFERFKKEVPNIGHLADEFKDMVSYFEGVLVNPYYEFNEKALSYILLHKVEKNNSWAISLLEPLSPEVMNEENLFNFLTHNYKVNYKKDLIHLILQTNPDSLELLKDTLFQDKDQIADFIMEQLEELLPPQELKVLVEQGVYNIFKDNPIMTIWFLKYLITHEKYKQFNMSLPDLYIETIYRTDTLGKIFSQKKLNWFKITLYTVEVKKIITMANDILFKSDSFLNYIKNEASQEYCQKIFQLTKPAFGLSSKNKMLLMKTILTRFPDIDKTTLFEDDDDAGINYFDESVIWTTQKGLNKQQKTLLKLQKERSDNLIELEEAREKGDLRENAEYQAAREKDALLTTSIQEIGEQLQKTETLDPSLITTEKVMPGTTVSLIKDGQKETYSIAGFWDTDEEKKVIAYNSPLARAIIGLKVDETISTKIGDTSVEITIKKITVSK